MAQAPKVLQTALKQLWDERDEFKKKHAKLRDRVAKLREAKAKAQADLDEAVEELNREYLPHMTELNTQISQIARAAGGRSLFDGQGVSEAQARGEDVGAA